MYYVGPVLDVSSTHTNYMAKAGKIFSLVGAMLNI